MHKYLIPNSVFNPHKYLFIFEIIAVESSFRVVLEWYENDGRVVESSFRVVGVKYQIFVGVGGRWVWKWGGSGVEVRWKWGGSGVEVGWKWGGSGVEVVRVLRKWWWERESGGRVAGEWWENDGRMMGEWWENGQNTW
jgi:hypothetical protein